MIVTRKHLAIFTKAGIDQIISGQKTIETRFSKAKIAPFGQIGVGDLVYLKVSGGEIKGEFRVEKVIFFEGLDQKDWEIIQKEFWDKASLGSKKLDQQFLDNHQNAKYGTVLFIGKVEQFITSPINFKKKDQRGWVVL